MSLSNDLISQFIKATNDDKGSNKKESTVYGTTVEQDGSMYVKIDGSDQLTPVSTTAGLKDGERVTVMIKNHSAIVTGNITSPSLPRSDLDDLNYEFNQFGDKISEFEILIANKVTTDVFNAEVARIDNLVADDVVIKKSLVAVEADIENIQADTVVINERLIANDADISNIKSNKLDTVVAEATFATIEELDATNARVYNLEATYGDFAELSADELTAAVAEIRDLSVNYANIDFSNIGKAAMEYFYSTSGLIKDVVVGDATITGKLAGVTISGDLIEGNTVKAEKLVIKGSDGLYYKLNTDGMKVEAQQTDENSINGQVIKAKSITATKIDVEDLVAFDATIGGFHITDSALYSGVKESVGNTTRGIYLDKDGQIALGDSTNFLKYYKDADGNYRLEISAKSLSLSSGTNVETAITKINNMEIGGRNLLIRSNPKKWLTNWYRRNDCEAVLGDDGWVTVTNVTSAANYGAYPRPLSNFPAGKYVLSFEAYSSDVTNLSYNYIMSSNGNTRISSVNITNVPTRYAVPITLSADIDSCSILLASTTGTSFSIRNIKFEKGDKPTAYTEAPEDIDSDISEAAKTATNFMNYDSTNGLQLGNKTSGSWVGFRTQITNAAFRILSSAGMVLASYGEKLIELGRNATDAVIKFCGGKGQIEYDSTEDYLQLSADNVRLKGKEVASIYSNYTDSQGNFRNGAVHAFPGQVSISASGGDDDSGVNVGPTSIIMATENYHISGVMNDSDNGGTYVSYIEGKSGIWTYKKWSNGDVEMWGSHHISNIDCKTAMGSMYRNAGAFSPSAFPFSIADPNVVASYESDGYGALLWATTTATTAKPPNYYLVRATSGTITSGKINFHVQGKWLTITFRIYEQTGAGYVVDETHTVSKGTTWSEWCASQNAVSSYPDGDLWTNPNGYVYHNAHMWYLCDSNGNKVRWTDKIQSGTTYGFTS